MLKMSINIIKKDFDYKHYDIDQLFNKNESRTVNEYFGIYKINMLICGGSGSGKTTFIINQILNNILTCDILLLFIPHETINSGFYQQLLTTDNFKTPILVFEIGQDKVYDGIKSAQEIKINDKRSNYIVEGMPSLNQLFHLKNELGFKEPLCCFDDYISVLTKDMWSEYFRFVHNISRLNGKIVSCCQSISRIPPAVRSSYTVVVLFTNYLTRSTILTLLKNCVQNSMLNHQNIEYLLDIIKKDPQKHNPLIIIGGDVDQKKSIIYNNNYVVLD